jgi:hypothetical protein
MDVLKRYIEEAVRRDLAAKAQKESEKEVRFKDEKGYKVVMFKFKEVKKKLGDAEKFFKREELKSAQMLLGGLTIDIKDLWKSI